MASSEPAVPAYLTIAEDLRRQILSGGLEPGTRLPKETLLAQQFGVSRSTVREALRHLASQHLVVTTQGQHGGTAVAEPTVAQIGDYVTSSVGLLTASGSMTFSALLEARAVLEVPVSRLAAERRTDAQLAALEATMSFQPTDDAPESHTRDFHLLLIEASGNPMIGLMARPVFDLLRVRYVELAANVAFWTEVKHDHSDIFAAVADRNPAAAADAMAAHLDTLITIYLRIEEAQGGDS